MRHVSRSKSVTTKVIIGSENFTRVAYSISARVVVNGVILSRFDKLLADKFLNSFPGDGICEGCSSIFQTEEKVVGAKLERSDRVAARPGRMND